LSISLRENLEDLTADKLVNIRTAFSRLMQIRDNRGYNHISGYHGIPGFYCWHHGTRTRRPRPSRPLRLFFPWHRAYLYWLEQHLKDQVPDIALPWWDWSSDASRRVGIPNAFSQEFANGEPNPLFKFHIKVPTSNPPLDEVTIRDPGDPSELPDSQMVTNILDLPDFDDFDLMAENFLHDNIHVWVGGSMSIVDTAAYDPIFWFHHCMVDRLWYLWQIKFGDSTGMEDMLDEVLEPFPLRVRDVLSVRDLGYDYAVSQIVINT
jgi:tyrosinase